MNARKPTALVAVCTAHTLMGWALMSLGSDRMPSSARNGAEDGSRLALVRLDVQARAADVQLLAGSGWRLFDEAALQQVRTCRFMPATQDGQAIDSWVEFPVRFALTG